MDGSAAALTVIMEDITTRKADGITMTEEGTAEDIEKTAAETDGGINICLPSMASNLIYGAGNEVRTRDTKLGKLVLYQLSYARL